MQEKRTHTRVPAKAIHETPANGVFHHKERSEKLWCLCRSFLSPSVCLRRSGQKMQKGRKRQKREKGEKRQKDGKC